MFANDQEPIRVPERKKAKRLPPPNYGSTLAKSFFERLKVFELESTKRKQDLCERINQEISEHLVKGMAGQHRIAPDTDDPMVAALQGRMMTMANIYDYGIMILRFEC